MVSLGPFFSPGGVIGKQCSHGSLAWALKCPTVARSLSNPVRPNGQLVSILTTTFQGNQLARIQGEPKYGRIPPKCTLTKFDMGNGA